MAKRKKDLNQYRADEASLHSYLRSIARHRVLSRDEESALAARIKRGDRRALQDLVNANLRFVVSVARTYQNQGLPVADLINEGNIGLIKAAKRFDERKNFKFISYAVWWIRQSILQALAHHSRITRLPLNQVNTIYRIGQAQQRLEQRHSRTPDADELAVELGIKKEKVKTAIRVGNGHTSLDAPLKNAAGSKLVDMISGDVEFPPDHGVQRTLLRSGIRKTLDELDPRQREVISLYFGLGGGAELTIDEIAARTALTREKVRQVKDSALKKLKRSATMDGLRVYQEA